jgi:valyl-tRNA synthetase
VPPSASVSAASATDEKKDEKKKDKKDKKVKKDKKPFPVAKSDKEKKPKKEKKPEVVLVDHTPAGEKKLLDGDFPASYQPAYVESAWQLYWEKAGFYKARPPQLGEDGKPKENFVMVIPPPNVTGSLHLGHALTIAIEDTLTRWHRMQGKTTLWIPGTDHAGIATQSVVEKRLKKEEGLTRHDLGREAFVERVWEWKKRYGTRISEQIRCLGASVDWERETFTMDPKLSTAVTEAFVRFHESGLVYRDKRLVNWSCALRSAISDIEVDHLDLEGTTFLAVPNHTAKPKYEFGSMTSFAYKVIDGKTPDETLIIATTRLETMLGDTAVAVHPEDPRYKHLHGKFVQHPFMDRKIPIITDDILVDMEFGTGAVKLTPAHDPNDNMCAKRHNLELIVIFDEDGRINKHGAQFAGMMRYDARIAIEEALAELGLFHGKEPHKMRLGLCSRSGDIIEPMLTPQWYVNCNSMAKRAVDEVRSGNLKIVPESEEATWFKWLDNIRDWCVSRQLWWGHRIPAYFARIAGEPKVDKNDDDSNNRWFVARTEAEALSKAAQTLGVPEKDVLLEQDEDVLDTWFSSGLFPFSVFGWPNVTEDFKQFYPTSLLETGSDILFFWVARMVMMALQLTDTLPFKTVYLHSMVRDKNGMKMSKSLGNVIDPLEVVSGCQLDQLLQKIKEGNLSEKEVKRASMAQIADFPEGIPECGTDALRFGLLAYTGQGKSINLDIKRLVGYRQFCNKQWNAVRFAVTYLTDFTPSPTMHLDIAGAKFASKRDLFILSKLNRTIAECNSNLDNFVFGAVASALHSFFIYDLCDVYLELIKPVVGHAAEGSESSSLEVTERQKFAKATLYTCLEQYLRLAHPLMPYVTEELWQRLPSLRSMNSTDESIMVAKYPVAQSDWDNVAVENDMAIVTDAIHAARSLRADYRIANSTKTRFYFRSESADVQRALSEQKDDFCTLGKGSSLELVAPDVLPSGCSVKVVSEQLSILIDLTGVINVEDEIARLSKELKKLTPQVEQYRKKMSIPNYKDKVPEEVQQINAQKLSSYESELETVAAAMKSFQDMLKK